MSSVEIVNILVAVLRLAREVGLNMQELAEAIQRSNEENRDLTAEEIQAFAADALEAIEDARSRVS